MMRTKLSPIGLSMIVLSISSPALAVTWKPYDFQGTEHFKYEIRSIKEDQKKTGFFTLDIEKKEGDQYKISFSSKLGDSEGSMSTTAPANELAGKLMMSVMMSGSDAGSVLAMTLFTQNLTMMFMGLNDFEVGAGWRRTEGGKKISFKIESKETIADQEGYKCVLREGDQIKVLQVVSPEVPLPLRTEMTDDDGSRYEAHLVEFTR